MICKVKRYEKKKILDDDFHTNTKYIWNKNKCIKVV